jgi:hypothetical protein
LLLGIILRQWIGATTAPLRFTANQQNAFYWGSKITHVGDGAPTAASWKDIWNAYVGIYQADEAHPSPRNMPWITSRCGC